MKGALHWVAVAILCASAFTSVAAGGTPNRTGRIKISRNDKNIVGFQVGSFRIAATKDGSEIAVVLGRATRRKDNSIEYNRCYVSKEDCISVFDKLVVLDASGSLISEVDFVANGESAAARAEVICEICLERPHERQDKGI